MTKADGALKEKILEAMKTTMRAQDKSRLGAIRLIQAAIKQKEVDERISLTDSDVLAVLDKMLRQRKESIKQFELAKRDDLVKQEELEIAVIQEFLPTALSPSEIQSLVNEAIRSLDAKTVKDMGKVMASLKPKLEGRADMGEVGALIKTLLSS